MTDAADDLARELLEAVRVQVARYGGNWPSEVERLVYQQLDTALDLYLAFLEAIDAEPDDAA